MARTPSIKNVLGFDFGMKRIGVAIGQTITQTANPVDIIKAKDGIPAWSDIDKLIQDWSIDAIVIGIPYNMDGTEQDTTHAARKFAHRLEDRYRVPMFCVDERLTTVEAKRTLRQSKPLKSRQLDSYAAKLILESWLTEHSKASRENE